MRILHVSDLHIDVGLSAKLLERSFRNKRLVGFLNLRLKRARHFKDASTKVRQLAEFADAQNIDAVFCTGDYTALGTASELEAAREVIEPLTKRPLGFFTVPGNHDVYLEDSLGLFEAHFSEFLASDLSSGDRTYPIVRFLGEDASAPVVIGLNSARPNPPIFRSSGRIPDDELDGVRDVLGRAELQSRLTFVLTHYAPRLENGQPDSPSHGLENADELMSAVNLAERASIHHGHVHHCYSVRVPECRHPMFSAGSTTQSGREGLWVYEIGKDYVSAFPGAFDGEGYILAKTPAQRW